MAFEKYNEEILFGRPSPWTGAKDFQMSDDDGKLSVRGLICSDIGNPGQISLRRSGPDNANFDHFPPEKLIPGQTIGHISFTAYEGTDQGWGERSAQIHSRYAGPGKGSLTLVTSGQDRLTIDSDGILDLSGLSDAQGRVAVSVNGRKGYIQVQYDNEG